MTVAVARIASGIPYVIHNAASNFDGVDFTLLNVVKDSSGNPFTIFDNSIDTVPADDVDYTSTDTRVFLV